VTVNTEREGQNGHSLLASGRDRSHVYYRNAIVDGVKVFYREAGDPAAPTVVLLHGFPTSSFMFRNLIPELAASYHVIAPDFPGFGMSDMPDRESFAYTFDHLAEITRAFLDQVGVARFAVYVQDYGAPVGFRLAAAQPDRVWAIVSQNGNAYSEGLTPFWEPLKALWANPGEETMAPLRVVYHLESLVWQYTHGVRDIERISPDTWMLDKALLDRPGNNEIQMDLFLDYGTNPARYPEWHEYFRNSQPQLLAVWGQNDEIFGPDGARAFARDLPDAEIHLLDTGHFALEEEGDVIADLMLRFLDRNRVPAEWP
jgi:pimeloyl-ACP methyl ester carboxylesterase